MPLAAELNALNSRLKAGGHRCRVEQRGSSLVLRATLPERDNPTQRRQQRLPLGLAAVPASLADAERSAIELAAQLRAGKFTWRGWTHESHPESVSYATFKAQAHQLARGVVLRTWQAHWAPALHKLPRSGEITPVVLLQVIQALPPASAARRDQGHVLARIAGSLGWSADELRQAARGYSAKRLQPRNIPEDEQIEAIHDRLGPIHWRWAWGMLAAFGLRPHELVSLQWLEGSWIEVADATKTGSRRVTACPSRWIERFSLRGSVRPNYRKELLASALNRYLRETGIRCPAYNLRHAYALRLMQQGVPPEYGARLMGHSLQMHEQTYKRWLDAQRITKAMERFDL